MPRRFPRWNLRLNEARRTVVLGLGPLAALAALGAASATPVSSASSVRAVELQRVAIEQRMRLGGHGGTFTLHPLTAGALERDSGRFGHEDGSRTVAIRGGQGVARYELRTDFTGARGRLVVYQRLELVAAGNGYLVGTGTWSIIHGTGAYAEMAGGGYQGAVMTPGGVTLSQGEGFVRAASR